MCNPMLIPAGIAVVGSTIAAKKAVDYVGDKLTPDIPKLPDAPDGPPRQVDPLITAARSREQDKLRAARGRQSTLLTGGGGLSTPASTAPKTLLGQ